MKKDIFAVCDPEAAYTERLMEYIHQKHGTSFEVQAFTSVQKLCEFAENQQISVLLVAAYAMNEKVRELSIEKVILLSEGDVLQEYSQYPAVYKYQASDSMISEVMECYAQNIQRNPMQLLKKKLKVIGVYSPISRALKTSFALTLGQEMAKKSAVLYLNMESYSGFETLLKKDSLGDFSDLLYFLRSGAGNLIYKVQGMVQKMEQLDYLPPFFSPEDLKGVTVKEWTEVLSVIEDYSAYEIVILDIGEAVNGVFELLNRCDSIYMPIREDTLSRAKLNQYERLIMLSEYTDIKKRTKLIKLPFHNSFGPTDQYIGQLLWGELGDFVRKMLREEQGSGRNATQGTIGKGTFAADGTARRGDRRTDKRRD